MLWDVKIIGKHAEFSAKILFKLRTMFICTHKKHHTHPLQNPYFICLVKISFCKPWVNPKSWHFMNKIERNCGKVAILGSNDCWVKSQTSIKWCLRMLSRLSNISPLCTFLSVGCQDVILSLYRLYQDYQSSNTLVHIFSWITLYTCNVFKETRSV